MVKMDRINVGRKEKRSFFNLTHDVNTTSDFGFCQPTLVRHFIKGSKINLKSNTFVRLAPLPVPTFGRVQCQQHTAFVPMSDVFEAFDYLQSHKSVSSALRSYIPQSTDYCSNQFLLGSLFTLFFSSSTLYKGDTLDKWLSSLPFRISVHLDVLGVIPQEYQAELLLAGIDGVFDAFNDERIYNNSEMSDECKDYIFNMALEFISNTTEPHLINILGQYFNNVSEGYQDTLPCISNIDYATGGITIYGNKVPLIAFSWIHDRYLPTSIPNDVNYTLDDLASLRGDGTLDNPYPFKVIDSRSNYLLDPLSIDNADYAFQETVRMSYNSESYNGKANICIHLTGNGKRLVKIFNSCRWHFGRNKPVSLDKLYSYFKVWFDKFNAGRNIQWRDTNCYKLIHSFYDSGIPTEKVFWQSTDLDYDFLNYTIVKNLRLSWLNFLLDLPNCVYCSPLDNITIATDSPILENTLQGAEAPLYEIPGFGGENTGFTLPVTRGSSMQALQDDSQPYYQADVNQTGLSVRLMQTLYKLVNKNSVLGSKVDDYLRAHGISNGLPKTKVMGDNKFMCSLDEVFATVNNDQSYLGEYAGKGVGSGSSENMHFETDSYGYLIQLTTIVPIGGYVQADSPEYISRYDFYQSEFDSLGMEVLPQSQVLGAVNYFFRTPQEDKVFGFVPRYFNLKVENNLQNGGFVFPSESASFLPYSLDKIISKPSIRDFVQSRMYITAENKKFFNDLPADEELRYIGRKEFYGNFDRIFYDTTGKSDNFIVHIVQELSMYAPMKAIDNSFETFDEFNHDDSISVEHS